MIDRNKKALNDIIYCIDLINRYTEGISKHEFLTSQEKQDLVKIEKFEFRENSNLF